MDIALLQQQKIRDLSNSSRGTFASCPRKSQLAKLMDGSREDTIHTVFGTAVAAGIQTWHGDTTWIPAEQQENNGGNLSREEAAILAVYLAWKIPFWSKSFKDKKSIGHAIFMVEKYIADCERGELPFGDWEFIGAEVGFKLLLPGGFKYRGFIDLVLRSPDGMPAVLEFKTTGRNNSSNADWKNSEQGTSYSLVLPAIVPGATKYLMYYVVGMSGRQEWVFYDFIKGDQEKLDFVQDLLAETKVIEFYEKLPRFPMRGTSCSSYGRECPFFGVCDLPTEKLVDFSQIQLEAEDKYQHVIDLQHLG